MIRDFGTLKEHGILPAAGGLVDQAPTFVDAIDVIGDALAEARKAMGNANGA